MIRIKKLRERILVFLAHDIGLPYFRLTRRQRSFPYTREALRHLPEGSVGSALFCFLKDNDLKLLPYYEKHDIKHVVLGYPPDEKGEICLQCCMLANGRFTLPVIATVLFGLLTMPEYYPAFYKAFVRGKKAAPLKSLQWFALMPYSLEAVRSRIFAHNQQESKQ